MAIHAQPLPLKEVLYWPSMKVLAMTQPKAAVFRKATFLRIMVVSMGRRCRHQDASQSDVLSQMARPPMVDRFRQVCGEHYWQCFS